MARKALPFLPIAVPSGISMVYAYLYTGIERSRSSAGHCGAHQIGAGSEATGSPGSGADSNDINKRGSDRYRGTGWTAWSPVRMRVGAAQTGN